MSDQPINMSSGLPTTVLPDAEPALRHALSQAMSASDPRAEVAAVVASAPRWSEGWAVLGDLGGDTIERYAAYRVGYHRGLDSLRAHGWRGSGYVRWAASGNQGFLRCLMGLHIMATEIGELDEAERCAQFLVQLDPHGVPSEIAAKFRR